MTSLRNPPKKAPKSMLDELTAEDLMSRNPQSVRDNATVDEAVKFLTDRAISGAPVINESGRPVGVISRTDLLIHERERRRTTNEHEAADTTPVSAVMTPIVFTAREKDTAQKVTEQMVALNVHRLFVVDAADVLIGVITPLDVLRKLV